MRRTLGTLLCFMLLISLTGCGTILNFMEEGTTGLPEGAGQKSVYGGVVIDIGLISSSPWFWEKVQALFLAGLIDLPLSLVMDTVTLPVTIPMTLSR